MCFELWFEQSPGDREQWLWAITRYSCLIKKKKKKEAKCFLFPDFWMWDDKWNVLGFWSVDQKTLINSACAFIAFFFCVWTFYKLIISCRSNVIMTIEGGLPVSLRAPVFCWPLCYWVSSWLGSTGTTVCCERKTDGRMIGCLGHTRDKH